MSLAYLLLSLNSTSTKNIDNTAVPFAPPDAPFPPNTPPDAPLPPDTPPGPSPIPVNPPVNPPGPGPVIPPGPGPVNPPVNPPGPGPVTPPVSGSTWNAFVWPTVVDSSAIKIAFPEQCPGANFITRPVDTNKVSLAFSGGGTRAYIAAVGQLRALNRMGYEDRAQYVSTSSGGAWFYGAYAFAQPKVTSANLLGVSCGLDSSGLPQPENLTMLNLGLDNYLNKYFMGHCASDTKILAYVAEALLTGGATTDQIWVYGMAKMFLKPYGLDTNAPVAYNRAHADSMVSRNKFALPPVYMKENLPFWLCGVSLEWPFASTFPNTYVSFNPLYSGIVNFIGDEKYGNITGGYAMETFCFGNTEPPTVPIPVTASANCSASDRMLLPLKISEEKNRVRKLGDLIGISSMSVFAAVALHPEYLNKLLPYIIPKSLQKTVPLYNFWGHFNKKMMTNLDSQCTLKGSECTTPQEYDPVSCVKYQSKCYSNTASQCLVNEDCFFNAFTLGCENHDPKKSSLNCRMGLNLKCGCVGHDIKNVQSSDRQLASVAAQQKNFSTTQNIVRQYRDISSATPLLESRQGHVIDTGFVDNAAIVPLLQRGVKKIIAFVNLSTLLIDPVPSALDPKGCDPIVSGLFGVADESAKLYDFALDSIQVFHKADWYDKAAENQPNSFDLPVKNQMMNRYRSGGPTWAYKKSLRVLPNHIFGVQGNYDVEILILYLQPCSIFVNSLRDEVKSQVKPKGKFDGFPCFATAMQNPDLGLLTLNFSQSNILATFADWVMNRPEIKAIVDEMYRS